MIEEIEKSEEDNKVPVSVIVHTRNECKNVVECIDSVYGWAAEIILADMESSDDTVTLAQPYITKLVRVPLEKEFDRMRNISASHADQPWVMFLDADERLTPKMRSAIEELLRDVPERVSAINLPFRVISFGRWIEHSGGWWPAYKSPPLLRSGKFHFPGGVHEPAVVTGEVMTFSPRSQDEAILHYSHTSVEAYIEKLNRYTSLEVEKKLRAGVPANWCRVATGLGSAMRWYFDDTNGKQDGMAGFLLSIGSGIYEAVAEMKLMESQGVDALPATSAEFFRVVYQAALPVSNTNSSTPSQVERLIALLPKVPRADSEWEVVHMTEAEKVIVELDPERCILIIDDQRSDPEITRQRIRKLFGAYPTRIFDSHTSSCIWIIWRDDLETPRRRVQVITHENALKILGGGEVQIFETVAALRGEKVACDVSIGTICSGEYDIYHLFSLHHSEFVAHQLISSGARYLISPVFWNRRELACVTPLIFELAYHSENTEALCSGFLSINQAGKRLLEKPSNQLLPDVWNTELIRHSKGVLANSEIEYDLVAEVVGKNVPRHFMVVNGVNPEKLSTVTPGQFSEKHSLDNFVLCAGRIEPNKNQLALLAALRDTELTIVLAGPEYHSNYSNLCKTFSGTNVCWMGELPNYELLTAMADCVCHCLPSLAETPGLVNLEAAALGRPIVVGDRASEREYFGNLALYANPLDPVEIRARVLEARRIPAIKNARALQSKILSSYTWKQAAVQTSFAYEKVLNEDTKAK